MDIIRVLIVLVLALEIVFYFVKYWAFIPSEKLKFGLFYGLPLFKLKLLSKHSKGEIINFIKGSIKPKKIISEEIFLRRKYLKCVMWATPVPLETKIIFNENNEGCLLDIKIKTIFITPIGAISPVCISLFSESIGFGQSILYLFFILFALYLFALLEKAAIVKKLNKIVKLDSSYTLFS